MPRMMPSQHFTMSTFTTSFPSLFQLIFHDRRQIYRRQLNERRKMENDRGRPPNGRRKGNHSQLYFIPLPLYLLTVILLLQHFQFAAVLATSQPTEQTTSMSTLSSLSSDLTSLQSTFFPDEQSSSSSSPSSFSTFSSSTVSSFDKEAYESGAPFLLHYMSVEEGADREKKSFDSSSGRAGRRGQGKNRPRLKSFVTTTTSTTSTTSTSTNLPLFSYPTEDYEEYSEYGKGSSSRYPKYGSSTSSTTDTSYYTERTMLTSKDNNNRPLPKHPNTSWTNKPPPLEKSVKNGTKSKVVKTLQEAKNTDEIWEAFEYHMNHMVGWEVVAVGVGGVLSFVTIVGNVLVMIAFKIDKQLQTISNYFILSLAVADLMIGAISMPLALIYMIANGWPMGPTICDFWLSIDYMNSNASVLNLLLISFDRYFSITRPLTYRSHRTTRNTLIFICMAWLLSIILWPPWIFAWPMIEGRRTVPLHQCYIPFLESNKVVTIVTAMLAFWLPVFLMCVLYWRIYRETEQRRKEISQFGMYAYPALSSQHQHTSRTQTSTSKSSNKSSSGGAPERVTPVLRTHLHSHNCPRAPFRKQLITSQKLAAPEDIVPPGVSSLSQERTRTPFELSKASADVTVPFSTLLPSSVACTQAHQLPTIFSTHDYVEEIVPFSASASAPCATSGTNGNLTLTDSFLAGNLEALRHRPEHDSMAEREYSHSGKSASPLKKPTKSQPPSSCWRILWFCCCCSVCSRKRISSKETAVLTSKGCPACTYHRAVRRRRRLYSHAQSAKSALLAQLSAKQQMAASLAQQGVIEYGGSECLSSSSAAQLVVHEASTSDYSVHSANVSKCPPNGLERTLDNANTVSESAHHLLSNGSQLANTTNYSTDESQIGDFDSSIYTIVIKLAQKGDFNESNGEQVSSCAASVKMMPATMNGSANGGAISSITLPVSISTHTGGDSNNNLPKKLTVIESTTASHHQPQSAMTISSTTKSAVTTASALALSHRSTMSMAMSSSSGHNSTHSNSQRPVNCEVLSLMMQVAAGANSLDEEDEDAFEEEDNFCVNCDLDDLTDTEDEQEADMQTEIAEEDHEQECMSTINGEGGEEMKRHRCCFCFCRRGPNRRGGGKERANDTNEPSTAAIQSSGQAVLRAHSASIPPQNKWDSKAAKTLSAILLAFIITWTPYNVLGELLLLSFILFYFCSIICLTLYSKYTDILFYLFYSICNYFFNRV